MIPSRWVLGFVRLLRRLLPSELRSRMEREMERTLNARLVEEGRGFGAIRVLASESFDILQAAVRARSGRFTDGIATHVFALRRSIVEGGRSLRRSPGMAVFLIGTIGVCVGGSTAVFSTVEQVLINPYPYENADRMVTLWRRLGGGSRLLPPTREQVEAWSSEPGLFEQVEASRSWRPILSEAGPSREVSAIHVAPSYFDFLGIQPVLGRWHTTDEAARGERVVVISEEFWSTAFGSDPAVLGQSIRLDGEAWTVIGVSPKGVTVPGSFLDDPPFWIPLTPGAVAPSVLATLPPGVSPDAARTRLEEISARLEESIGSEDGVGLGGVLMPIAEMRSRPYGTTLRILSGAAALLLLIAAANLSNLLLWRGIARRRESAVRVALGARRGRVLLEHLMESVWLSICGGALGVALGIGLIHITDGFRGPASLIPPVEVRWSLAAIAFGVALLISIVVNVVPSIRAAGRDPADSLHSGGRAGQTRGDRRFGWSLVVVEIALSFALVVTTGLLAQTVLRLHDQPVGFELEGLVSARIQLPEWRYASVPDRVDVLDRIERILHSSPGVEQVSLSEGSPPQLGILFGTFEVDGVESPSEEVEVFFGSGVDPLYFETLNQPVIEGRVFLESELSDSASVAIVSETVARTRWPNEANPVGSRFRFGADDPWLTVVGVVGDIYAQGLGSEVGTGQVYVPALPSRNQHIVMRGSLDPSVALSLIADVVRTADPEILISSLDTTENRYAATAARQRVLMWLLIGFSTIALFLAVLGIYGVLSQVVGSRTREIGIRMTLGARRGEVVERVVRSALAVGAIGIVFGAGMAVAAGRWIESQLYEVTSRDPLTYVATSLILLLVVGVASMRPAQRASRVEPVQTLRMD